MMNLMTMKNRARGTAGQVLGTLFSALVLGCASAPPPAPPPLETTVEVTVEKIAEPAATTKAANRPQPQELNFPAEPFRDKQPDPDAPRSFRDE